jgi:predicted ester cyclase
MPDAEHEAVIRRYVEEMWHAGDLAIAGDLFAADYVGHRGATRVEGVEGARQWVARLRASYPDGRFTIDDAFGAGDRWCTRWTFRGTHRGESQTPLGPVAPTGREVAVTGLTVYRFASGRVAESWSEWDLADVLRQLGVLPAPDAASR